MEPTQETSPIPDGLPPRERTPAVIVVLLCIVMSSISMTLVNIALPIITKDFQIRNDQAIYIVSLSQLVSVLFVLVFSSLGDKFGYKQVFLCGLTLFTLASFGCGLSPNLPTLLFWRVIQGLGATAIQGVYLAMMTLIYPKQLLGRGLGISTTVFALASVVGPSIAAVILHFASWHWLFYINIPFGLVIALIGWRYLPNNPVMVKQPLDKDTRSKSMTVATDIVLHILTFGLFFVAASSWSNAPGQWEKNTVLSVLCVVIAFIYIRVQCKREKPFLPMDLLRRSAFAISVVFSILFATALIAMVLAIPFIMTSRFGYGPMETGLLLTVFSLFTIVSSVITGYAIERTRPIFLIITGFALFAAGMFLLAVLPQEHVTFFDLAWRLGLCGIAGGFFQPANNFIAMNATAPDRKGAAGGLLSTAMLFGQFLGMLLVTAIFCIVGNDKSLVPFAVSGTIMLIGMGIALACVKKDFS